MLGNLTELALPLAFLRGLFVCVMFLAFGMLEDLRFARTARRPGGLILMTAMGLIFGTIAFVYAWNWAGRSGPVHRLTSRACGTALGYLIPAAVTSHALYFHWTRALQIACGHGLLHVVGLISRGSLVVSN